MSSDDDSEFGTSSREFLESPLKAQREALKKKLQKEGMKSDASKQGTDLKNLKLSVLKAQVSGKKDDQAKKDQESKNMSQSFGTKTREQEIAASKMTAETKVTTDQMVDQGNIQQKVDQQIKQDETQSEDA